VLLHTVSRGSYASYPDGHRVHVIEAEASSILSKARPRGADAAATAALVTEVHNHVAAVRSTSARVRYV
jgi:hypothetical protein